MEAFLPRMSLQIAHQNSSTVMHLWCRHGSTQIQIYTLIQTPPFPYSLHTLPEQCLELLLSCAVLSLVAASLMASSLLSVHLRRSQQHEPSNRIGICITIQMQSSQAKQAVWFKATGGRGCIESDTIWAVTDCWAPSESHFLEIKEGSGCVSTPTISECIIKLTSNLYRIISAGKALSMVQFYSYVDLLLYWIFVF